MNHHLWTATGARVLAVAFTAAGLAACGDRISDTHTKVAPKPLAPSPSAVVIGQAPAEPTGDPAGTTPVAGNTTEVTKSVETSAMPQPGQPNDHSNLASKPSQKADEIATSPQEGKQANSGNPSSERTQ